MQAASLAGDVAVDVVHELGLGVRIGRRQDEVKVVGCEVERVEPNIWVQLERPAEHAEDQVVEFGRGPQQEALLDGADGDLEDCVRPRHVS